MRALQLSIALAAFAIGAPARAAEDVHVFISRGELHYFGPMESDAVKRLDALYKLAEPKPKVLSIRSEGGPVGAGMALGAWVKAKQLDLKVLEFCLSSCANYVFPAAPNKTVSNFAVIGFHGGAGSNEFTLDPASQKMLDALPQVERDAMLLSIKNDIAKAASAETTYFKELGVRPELTRLGQTEAYQARYGNDDKMVGWTYSAEDFAKLGVRNITVVNGPWLPRMLSGKITFFQVPVQQ